MGEVEGVAGEKITGSSNSTWNEPALSQREKANQLGFRPAELKEVSLMLTHHPNAEPVMSPRARAPRRGPGSAPGPLRVWDKPVYKLTL